MKIICIGLLLCATALAEDQASVVSQTQLSNKDIMQMRNAAVDDAVIVEKIRASRCDFDTSPNALAGLKRDGVPDSIALEMVRCNARSDHDHNSLTENSTAMMVTGKYALSTVRSDRKWRFGFRSEPYDKISQHLETKLAEDLDQRGLHRLAHPDGQCMVLTIELLEVSSHPAMIKKPGMDVTVNIAITDGNSHVLYSKGYRGESRTVMNTWGHLIDHATEEAAKSIADDDNVIKTLSGGRP